MGEAPQCLKIRELSKIRIKFIKYFLQCIRSTIYLSQSKEAIFEVIGNVNTNRGVKKPYRPHRL